MIMMALVRTITGRGLYRCMRFDFTRTISTRAPLAAANTNSSKESKQNQKAEKPFTDKTKPLDDLQYIVRFKTYDVKKIFKQFYTVYGPLFVACHIGVSLVSLGFFCSLTWSVVDPTTLIPRFLDEQLTDTMLRTAGTSGKFVMAYALHKMILPIRLGTAIWATRKIATRVEYFRKRVAKTKEN